jgi:hypothetical protein
MMTEAEAVERILEGEPWVRCTCDESRYNCHWCQGVGYVLDIKYAEACVVLKRQAPIYMPLDEQDWGIGVLNPNGIERLSLRTSDDD